MSNNRKKWLIIAIISLVLFAAEVVFSIFFLLPMMKTNKVVDKIKSGDSSGAAKIMRDLSDSNKKSAKEKVDDLIVKMTNDYIAGKTEYESLKKVLIAVENVEAFYGMSEKCFMEANKKALLKEFRDVISGDAEDEQKLNDVYYIVADGTAEDGSTESTKYLEYFSKESQENYQKAISDYFDAVLKADYESYKSGNGDALTILKEADIIDSNIYTLSGYSSYATDIKNDMKALQEIQKYLDQMNNDISTNDYNAAIDTYNECLDKYGSQQAYSELKEQLDAAKEKAHTEGVEYYTKAFDKLREAKDKASAETLYSEIEKNFGGDLDKATVLSGFLPEWGEAYVAFLNDYEKNIKAAMDSGNPLKKYYPVSSANYDEDKPTSYSLYDMDGDKVPELIIYGELISHVFTFRDGKISYVMTVGRIAYKNDGTFASLYQKSAAPAAEKYHAITVTNGKAKCTKFTTGIVNNDGNMSFVVNSRESDYDGFYKAATLIVEDAVDYIPETDKLGTDYEKTISDYSE
ncbi:hypothetical protein SAMN04487934_10323 [Eubacterium ruminantium]|nr:hypothetical protein SAMN04487934_10323 [Eubacterium ruminantium]